MTLSYGSAYFDGYMVNMVFPRQIFIILDPKMFNIIFMLQSHLLVLVAIKYHDSRLISKFPLRRAEYNKITFSSIQGQIVCS